MCGEQVEGVFGEQVEEEVFGEQVEGEVFGELDAEGREDSSFDISGSVISKVKVCTMLVYKLSCLCNAKLFVHCLFLILYTYFLYSRSFMYVRQNMAGQT